MQRRKLYFFACLLVFSQELLPQAPSVSGNSHTNGTRDPQAVTFVTNAVAALGGHRNIAAVHDCIASGDFSSPGNTWLRYTSFAWKNSGDQYSYELTGANDFKSVDRSGHGKPSLDLDGKKRPRHENSPASAYPVHLVAVRLLQLLEDPKFDLIYGGPTALNGSQVMKVTTRYNRNELEAALTLQNWYFDQDYRPIRVEYQVGDAHDASSITKLAADLTGYATVDGVAVPMQITFWMDGSVGATATINDIHFNSAISSSDFD